MKNNFEKISWLLGDNVLSKIVGLFVTTMLASRLGVSEFGSLSYVFSTTALFAVVGHLGLNGIIQRELVRHPLEAGETLGTIFVLKIFSMLIVVIIITAFAYSNPIHTKIERQLFLVMSFVICVQVFSGLILNWFYISGLSKQIVYSNQIGLMVSACGKLFSVWIGTGLLIIGLFHASGIVITSVILFYFYLKKKGPKLVAWKFSIVRAKLLLSECWKVFLGGIFATIYLKIDMTMMRTMKGQSETGVYAVSALISEASWFIPIVIVTVIFPRLIKSRESNVDDFNKQMLHLYEALALAGIVCLAFIWCLAPFFINLAFGEVYKEAIPILFIHSLALPLVFMRQGFSRWILICDMTMFSLLTNGAGALLNVGLNFVLIPFLGGIGAAIATVVSYSVASYIFLFLFKDTRDNFYSMSKALFHPYRVIPRLWFALQCKGV